VSTLCGDCGVASSERHEEGCDVARCTACGYQRIGCDCKGGQPTVWKGEWPGDLECREYGWLRDDDRDPRGFTEDLNRLAVMTWQMRWDSTEERWFLRELAGEST
jgi:hypothetical protein